MTCRVRQNANGSALAFVKLPAQIGVIRSPGAVRIRVFRHELLDGVHLRVEVIEEVQRNRFQCHRQFGAAKVVLAMMTDNHVLQSQGQVVGKRLVGEFVSLTNLFFEHADTHHDVADELPLIAVGEVALVSQFVDLADIVQEGPKQQQVGIEIFVEWCHDGSQLHQAQDMLQEASTVGVMILNSRRC